MGIIPANIYINVLVLLASFYVLTKGADFLVDGSVGIAFYLKIPKIVIGIVLVSLATTAPEFTVSVLSSLRGKPEIALGNALGSVIADNALALALGAIVAPVAIKVESRILKSAGLLLVAVSIVSFIMALNGTISRIEGLILLGLFISYLTIVVLNEKRLKRRDKKKYEKDVSGEVQGHVKSGSLSIQFLRFTAGVAGVIIASEFLIDSAVFIASYMGISEAVIGLTMIAIGTSLPEIATCIVSARKGYGELAVGDIIGADIMNLLWIIGTASAVHPISVSRKIIYSAFPWELAAVVLMLGLMRMGYKLQRWKGFVLLLLYVLYIIYTIVFLYS
ncbi:MAG: calcium/sodium antiporter [Spirochaetales bacterium]|nr:calcium/sodium antiporter [Spirochaetales bacterium]